MGQFAPITQTPVRPVESRQARAGMERETVLSLLAAKDVFETLDDMALDLQHVSVLGAVVKLGLRRLIPSNEEASAMPFDVPDFAFQPVPAQRVRHESPIPFATLRRRLSELVDAGLLVRTEEGYLPVFSDVSALVAKLQTSLTRCW